jgi:glutamate/tyrosine decarboxylase-like PLP-dependent enzyme
MLPESPDELHNLNLADSVALDPHKWLYAPLEAGCLLVKEPKRLVNAFAFHPDYYHFDEAESDKVNFYEYGPQNSRGFRALKVWLGLRHAGRQGYLQMLRDDVALAKMLYDLVEADERFEAFCHSLSITNFRYVPQDLPHDFPEREAYLNELNTAVMEKLRYEGQAFISNALINGKFSLRACIVNFRTTAVEIERLPKLILHYGKELDAVMRSQVILAEQ